MADGDAERQVQNLGPELPLMQAGAGFELLAGIRVLELSSSIAGPYAGMLLGDFGAEVVKVERPQAGDDARAWGPPFLDGDSLWFLAVNRNKRSIALDYGTPRGLEVLRDLVARADVIIVNQPRRALEKIGIAPEDLLAIRPDLVYVAVTGFGLSGARADWACYDLIAEGYSGVMDLTGELDGDPQKVGVPAADMLAGQDAAFAALAALYDRSKSGRGRVIDVSLVESMTRFLSCRIVPYLGSGEVPRRSGAKDSVIAVYQAFRTADEPITLALGNDNIWRRFWSALGDTAYGDDPRFATNSLRRRHRAQIVDHIQGILETRTRDYWLATFRAARIPAGPINRVDEVAADPELRRRGLFYAIAGEGAAIPQVGTGIHINAAVNVARLSPPPLGRDTEAVLAEWLGHGAPSTQKLQKDDTTRP